MDKQDILAMFPMERVHPGFSIDCVIFGFDKKKIKVLLFKFPESNLWKLPGGFMFKEETAEQAAQRILNLCTGLEEIYLRQFYLFSDLLRATPGQNQYFTSIGHGGEWLFQRFVTLGYYALLRYDEIHLPKDSAVKIKWYDIKKLPELYADHCKIIEKALETIKIQLAILPIAYQLLPEKFTLGELRKIYEIMLDKTYDRRNFQRKALASGLIVPIGETKGNTTYNPALLYSFSPHNDGESIDYTPFL